MINRRYVVTAATCHNLRTRNERIKEVVLGDYNLSNDPDCYEGNSCWKPAQRFSISPVDVTVHENWDIDNMVNEGYDIALIRLPTPAYTSYELCQVSVVPICLPWGQLSNGLVAKMPQGKYVLIRWPYV